MAKIDRSELKRIIAAMKSRKLAHPPEGTDFTRPPRLKNRRAAGRMIESIAKKAGLDVSKVNQLLTEDQKVVRAVFEKEQAEAAKHFRTAQAAFRSSMAARLQALGLLGRPFTSSFQTLDKPFLIWQLPHPELDIFIDSHIESMNNSVKVLVNVIRGFDSTQFVFFFLWRNESD